MTDNLTDRQRDIVLSYGRKFRRAIEEFEEALAGPKKEYDRIADRGSEDELLSASLAFILIAAAVDPVHDVAQAFNNAMGNHE